MKKVLFLFILCSITVSAFARHKVDPQYYADSLLPRFCIDLNFKGGWLSEGLSTIDLSQNYANNVNSNIGSIGFANGHSYGADLQLGYFFGKRRHWGLGAGIMYFYQTGDLSLNQFHIEYKAYDVNNDVYRQLLTANNPIKEKLTINSFSIPLVLKYKKQFSPHWGFTADMGLLFNLSMKNSYNTNASFDYEAIYKFVNGKPVYDAAVNPDGTDWLITKAKYTAANSTGSLEDYFNATRAQGYNVGLNVKPNSSKGSVTYNGTIGLMFQPSLTYRINDYLFFNLGAYGIMQIYDNSNNNNNYRLTDNVGNYNSLTNAVSTSYNFSYGINIGLRLFMDGNLFRRGFSKKVMPIQYQYNDNNTAAPKPDANEPDYEQLYSNFAKKPEPVKPAAQPVYDGEDIPVKIVYFATAKYNLTAESCKKLNQVAAYMRKHPGVNLLISGHTDIEGTEPSNEVLSDNRAKAVKEYLEYKGIDPSRMTTRHYASRYPADTNNTPDGRALNRRTEMEIIVK